MARTKADAYTKAGGKASRKTSIAKPSANKIKKKGSKGGLSPAVRLPVPKWQNPITEFFSKNGNAVETEAPGKSNKCESFGSEEPCSSKLLDQSGCSSHSNGSSEEIRNEDDCIEEKNILEEPCCSKSLKNIQSKGNDLDEKKECEVGIDFDTEENLEETCTESLNQPENESCETDKECNNTESEVMNISEKKCPEFPEKPESVPTEI